MRPLLQADASIVTYMSQNVRVPTENQYLAPTLTSTRQMMLHFILKFRRALDLSGLPTGIEFNMYGNGRIYVKGALVEKVFRSSCVLICNCVRH